MLTVRRTIVMIHPGGLGDVLLAVPAIVRLRTRFPNHCLTLCAEDQVAKLLIACRIIDEWASVQGRVCADMFAGADSVTGQVQTWLEDCDFAIGWMQDLDGTLNETLKAVGARKVVVRSPFSTAILATHQCDRFLESIDEIPSDDEADVLLKVTEPLINLGGACLETAGFVIGQLLVVIHPGSGSAHKCVVPETLASVVVAAQIFGATPVVLEGPADREPVERLLQLCVNPPIVLKGLDVLTVAGVLALVRPCVGQDSGVRQIAGPLGGRRIGFVWATGSGSWGATAWCGRPGVGLGGRRRPGSGGGGMPRSHRARARRSRGPLAARERSGGRGPRRARDVAG